MGARKTKAKPRTKAECRAAIKKWRRKARAIRELLSDPGDGHEVIEEFKRNGPLVAKFWENLADELEASL